MKNLILGAGLLATGLGLGAYLEPPAATAAPQEVRDISPVKGYGDRHAYFPNTEELAPDEMRVIALGTGMPNQRPKQKATCFLVELGNGDKFLFDVGTGSTDNLAALEIPYDFLDKVFISHLHSDHFGDLDALFVGGLVSGRTRPLRVWGPSGATPEMGTKSATDGMLQMLAWDIAGRRGRLPASGQELEVHEFDYLGENQVVFDENGVVVRSWPANHVLDGAVGYSLSWNGLKFVFGGDTYPSKWFVEGAEGADFAIHECFIALPDLIDKMNFTPDRALEIGTQIHTAPPAFGKVMSIVKPRLAVAYHFFNDFDTAPNILTGIRQTYDGPLSLAEDMLVWNVTKDEITEREVIFQEAIWPPPLVNNVPVDMSIAESVSDQIRGGNLDVTDVIDAIYERANETYGTNIEPNQH